MIASRRSVLLGAAGLVAAPRLSLAQAAQPLRFVPQADLTVLDPIYTTATVTLTHGFMVFDTLYALDEGYNVRLQMAEGHVVERDGLEWTITLREGLKFHDGEPVRGADCVASIRRWAQRDMVGAEFLAVLDEMSAPTDRTIRIRLKRPFPLLPKALGKVTAAMPAIMPERIASATPASRQVTEMVGSGPFRFLADERLSGVRVAYARFDGYVPRNEPPSRTAGGKVAHLDRVEWQVLPDASTAAGALTTGEVDWLEYPATDLAPMLRRNRDVTVAITDERSISVLRFNHLQAPFNNPGVRRALLGALDQSAYMTAAFGDDRALWREAGVFLSGTPMANDAGMAALRGPRDMDKVKRDLAAAGYAGEKTVLLQANDFPLLKALSEVAADMMTRAGMNLDVVAADWGTIGARRASKEPVDKGGWSAFTSGFSGAGMLDPVANLGLRAHGQRAWFGWPDSPELEQLRRDWMDAPDTAAQQQVARAIQERFWIDLPYLPLGEYSRMTAYRKNIVDIPVGLPSFWGVRRV